MRNGFSMRIVSYIAKQDAILFLRFPNSSVSISSEEFEEPEKIVLVQLISNCSHNLQSHYRTSKHSAQYTCASIQPLTFIRLISDHTKGRATIGSAQARETTMTTRPFRSGEEKEGRATGVVARFSLSLSRFFAPLSLILLYRSALDRAYSAHLYFSSSFFPSQEAKAAHLSLQRLIRELPACRLFAVSLLPLSRISS